MESLTAQVVSAAKLPILNPNEFNLQKMRIEQYFLMTDYSLWERLAKKNELKACGTLLMALPDKHQLKFNIHKDGKTLIEAIEKRFRGNKETKKVQKTLLKQQYENFTGSNINLKFLRSLPTEWRTHTLIWRNKTDLEEQSLDDLFNSLRIYEAEVKSSFTSTSTQNISFVSSSNTVSTNEPVSATTSVSAVECYNCHKKGHFARECKPLKDTRRNGVVESQRRNVPVETSTSNVLVSQCDGVGSYDWSFQAEEEPTNYALIVFTSSSSSSDHEVVSCSKACTKAYATLQSHDDKLTYDFRKSQFDVISYKTGLESAEARLLVYQQNETVYEEDIKLLNIEVQLRDNALVVLRQNLKKSEQEKDDLKLKLEKYQSGDGYHAIPPPYIGTFMPPKSNLVFHDAPNVNETAHTTFNVELSPSKTNKDLSHTHRPSAPITEDWVSDSEDDSEAEIAQIVPSFVQPTKHVKTPRPSVKTIETFIPTINPKTAITKPTSNGNRRNRKACFVCKSLDHLIKDCDFFEKKMAQTPAWNHVQRGDHQQYARMTLLILQNHVIPIVVLTESKLVPIIAARPVTIAIPKPHVTRPRQAKFVVTKPHSLPRRHINHSPSPKASNFPPKVTAVKVSQVNAAKSVQGKWEWKPKCPILDHASCNTSALMTLKRFSYNDALGRCKSGGKIFGKGKIRTGKLDFNDVYFIKELKFNLFSVSQMCEKKNNVLFTNTKYLVLSPEFKLPDENQVLLRVPRENNMYNVDLKNIVPSRDLTYLFAKATLDESNLWHRRLGHINFKTMNKLVKGNLVRGLPIKVFENNHTCVACKKGKQHRASYDYSRFTWVFFLATKDETSSILKTFITGIENQLSLKNTDGDASFKVKEPEFEGRKPQSKVYVSPSSSAQTKEHDDKTKREAKGKSHIESSIGYRNLSEEFEYFSDNSINEVNAVDSLVPAIGKISTNNTNTFSAVGPSNVVVSPPHGKSSYMDTSQLPDDPNMPELEDITYSDDEDDVGAEADFTNLEKTITEELLQFKIQKVWVLVDLPNGKRTIGFEDPDHPDKVYKVVKALYGLHQAPRACLTYGKSASTPIDTEKPLLKDPDGEDVDVRTYISMIGSLMYLTSSRPDIMFAVCVCARFQVTPKASHLHAVKRIFRYLKGKPHLGLWYPKDSPFNLVTYSDSDYAGASLDKKSTTRGCQFLRCRLISLQCKKQTVMATSSTEAELNVTAVSSSFCCLVNDVTRLQALVDKKKVVIIEATIRDALRLDDAEGIICLPNEEIFTELARMGYEKPSTKLTFYKAFFSSQWKFLIYTILQCISAKRTSWNEFSSSMALAVIFPSTGKGFSGVDTPLFKGMLVAQKVDESAAELNVDDVPAAGVADEGATKVNIDVVPAAVDEPSIPSLTQPTQPPPPSQDIPSTSQGRMIVDIDADVNITLKDIAKDVAVDDEIEEKPTELYEVVEVVTTATLITKVVTTASATITAAAPQLITATVPTLTTVPSAARRRKGVTKEQMKEEDNRALKKISESKEDKVAKKQKLDEEVEELKRHLKIVPNDEDGAYTKATPLARKVPIVDYEIYTENNKPYYKIIRADRSPQLFLSFLSLLRNFDREDLEVLWNWLKKVNVDDVLAAGVADEGAASVNVDVVLTVVDETSIPSPPPTTQPPPPSQDLPSTSHVQPTPPSPIAQPPSPPQQPHSLQYAEISIDLLHTLMETGNTLTRRVEHLEQDKIAQSLEITKLKQRVKKLKRRNKLKVSKLRRLKKVGTSQRVDTCDDTVMDDVSKQEKIIASMDADVDVTLKVVADVAKDVDDVVKDAEIKEIEVVTTAKLITEVVIAASATITIADATIPAAAPTLTTAPRKGFSRVDTPLFEGMIVAQQVDESAAKVNVDDVPAAGVADEGAASVNVDVVLTVVD
nr:ribonuclease H-like domain-containing protein [Tanacetum cinerariifolium]